MKINLVLLGMMGVGKSSTGKTVALRLGLNFIDTDLNIEEKCSMKISEIFKKKGEEFFRKTEEKEVTDDESEDNIESITADLGDVEANVEDICVGPRQTSIESNELLISINFPINPSGFGASYLRFIPRNEMDIAVAAAGVSVVIENGKFINARVSLASVAPKPLFVKEAGDVLVGKSVSPESIQEAAILAKDAATPISDMRGTAEYRKHLCEVLTQRALDNAIARAQEN